MRLVIGLSRLLMALIALAGEPAIAGARQSGADPGAGMCLRLPLAPFGWLFAPIAAVFRGAPELPNSVALYRDAGWTSLTFEVDEPIRGVFLEVRGRAEFDAADILCTEGDVIRLDLGGHERGAGLYALHELTATTYVDRVRLTARSLGSSARVGVRLER